MQDPALDNSSTQALSSMDGNFAENPRVQGICLLPKVPIIFLKSAKHVTAVKYCRIGLDSISPKG